MAAILKNHVLKEFTEQMYLAGGTAVALHLGHRLSIDFDFFTPLEIDSLQWHKRLQNAYATDFKLSTEKIEKNTLVMNLNDTGFSIFQYPYPLIEEPVSDAGLPLPVASLLDLACMKLIAVNQRGTCKDFIDLKFIMENEGFALSTLLQAISRKYAVGEEMSFQIKKSLVYFDDAERDLNVNMYTPQSGIFERLSYEEWLTTRHYFEKIAGGKSISRPSRMPEGTKGDF
jgi:predicted nucleotidyltransferase component of viral defense system